MRGAQADGAGDVRRARLELVRQRVPGASLERDRADHVAAAHERRHGLEQRGLAVEHADARRAVELVAREHIEVAVERLDVDAACDTAACDPSISTGDAMRVRQLHDLVDRIDGAERIRQVRHRHHLRARPSSRSNCVHNQLAAIVYRRHTQPGARQLAEQLPRHDIRVVLHGRDEDLVARADVGVAPRSARPD